MKNKEYKSRFAKAAAYLISKEVVPLASAQTYIVKKTGRTSKNASELANGEDKYFNSEFVSDFNNAFGGIFNENWFFTGEGDMIKVNKESASGTKYVEFLEKTIEDKDETIKDLRSDKQKLEKERDEFKSLYLNSLPLSETKIETKTNADIAQKL